MKVNFVSHDLVAGNNRRETIIDMIHKGETRRTENGEDFLLRYKPDGEIMINVTAGRESWMINRAWVYLKNQTITEDEKAWLLRPSTIIKMAQRRGMSITLVSMHKEAGNLYFEMANLPPDVQKRNLESDCRRNTVEVDRIVRKYNRQARKLVAALRGLGVMIYGRCTGSGEWDYTTRMPTASDELVWNNID